MAWENDKPPAHMAGQIPHGRNEPAFKEMYKGCTIWCYFDSKRCRNLVMLDKDDSVRSGGEEAMRALTRANLEKKYTLEFVREV